MTAMPRFYTLPPIELPYPYILINANRPEEGLRYIAKHRSIIEAVIIDSGVEIFRDLAVKEYPGGPRAWIEKKIIPLYKRAKNIVSDAEIVATIPDYPDDYHPKSLWVNGKTNIERTLDNILYAIENHSDVDWLIPVQGHYEKPSSIEYSIRLLRGYGIIDWVMKHTRYFAVANLCVSKKCRIIWETVEKAWRLLPGDAMIHVFGPAVNCLKRIWRYIYSFDSTAWTRPRAPNGSSAYNSTERAYLFLTWLWKYADLIDLPPHPKTMRKRLQRVVVDA